MLPVGVARQLLQAPTALELQLPPIVWFLLKRTGTQ